jgi:hypothetical protein
VTTRRTPAAPGLSLARRRARRRARGAYAALLACLATVALAVAAPPAQATGYRYWSFWERAGGSWRFAQSGPALTTPSDGDVEGWRFGVSPDSADALRPRGDARFAAICPGAPAGHGRERIALVLDYGTAADAPGGTAPPAGRTACATVPAGATAADALAVVAKPLRYDSSGMVCGISGYPATGCGEQVASGTAGPAARPAHSGGSAAGGSPSVGLFAGAAVVSALGAAAFWRIRGRRER